MAVFKRTRYGATSWYFEFYLAGSSRSVRRRVRKFGFVTRKAAIEAEARARREEHQKNPLGAPAADTLGHLLEEWLRLHCEGNLAGKTVKRYRDHVTYLAAELLELAPDEVKAGHLTAEWKRLATAGGRQRNGTPRPLGSRSVRHIASTLASAFNWGIGQELVNHNPVTHSHRPKAVKKRAVTVTSGDLELLLQSEGGFWCRRAYIATAEALGKRRGELCALRWADWQDGRMVISRSLAQYRDVATGEMRLEFKSTKADEIHSITVPALLVPILAAHRAEQDGFKRELGAGYQDYDLIFCEVDGRPFHPDSISASISALCRQLKLPKGTSLHSLRHTHASVLLTKKVPVAAVQQRLGHKNIRTTIDIYSHWLRDDDDRAAEAYDDYRAEHRTRKPDAIQ
jgi:integrase